MATIYHAEIPVNMASHSRTKPCLDQFFYGDNNSHVITALVADTDNPTAGLLTGTVSGVALRANGTTVPLEGEKGSTVVPVTFDGVTANATPCSVTLPSAAFAIPGALTISVRITDGTDITTVLSMTGTVIRASTDAIVDPGELIPDVTTLQEAAAAAMEAAADAEAAASSAVRYDETQDLDPDEMAQGRYNIGAMSSADIEHVDGVGVVEFRRNYGIATNGATVDIYDEESSSTGYAYAVVDCAPGDVFTITGDGGNKFRLWCFITSDGSAIDPRADANIVVNDLVLTAPDTAAKLVINSCLSRTPGSFAVRGIPVANQLENLFAVTGVSGDEGEIDFVRDFAITTSGSTVDITSPTPSTSGFGYAIANCTPGDVFTITGRGGSGMRLWCFITSDGSAIDPRAAANATASALRITAPTGAAMLVVNSNFTLEPNTSLVKGRIMKQQIAENTAEIEENAAEIAVLEGRSDYIPGADLLDGVSWTDGSWIDYKGDIRTGSQNLRLSDYVPVSDGRMCVVFAQFVPGGSTDVTTSIAAFDSNQNFIRRIGEETRSSGTACISATIPMETAFVRVSTGKSTLVSEAALFVEPSVKSWSQRKWYAIGDSITYGCVSTGSALVRDPAHGWPRFTANILGYSLMNYAVPGMGYVQIAGDPPSGLPNNLPAILEKDFSSADLVTVLLGINDWRHDTTLGTISDTSETESIYGRIRLIVETMQTKCPTARLVFMTPIPSTTHGTAETQYCKHYRNSAGYTLDDVKEAVIECCLFYGIEYINLLDTCPINYANVSVFLLDDLHPSLSGHRRLGEWMAGRICF